MRIIILAFIGAFFITLLIGKLLIPIIKKLKLGQNILECAPKSHQKKAGTPTFGGIIFITGITVVMLIMSKSLTSEGMLGVYGLIIFGIVGFIDDWKKKIQLRNEGLKRKEKMILLIIAAGVFAVYAYLSPTIETSIYIPIQNVFMDIKWIFVPFIIFYYVGTANAVNITDGLDGLCTTISILVMLFFGGASYFMGHESLTVFCVVVAGALLAFLIFNTYPAKIIMGDTGALALGGAVATVAMLLKLELILVVVGVIYVIEALSVMIQVTSIRKFKRRIFKMAPIHHSFEVSGWHETRVVVVFAIVTIIAEVIGIILLSNI